MLMPLAVHRFHAIGHHATFRSIQWKAIFSHIQMLSYPVSFSLALASITGPLAPGLFTPPLLAVSQHDSRPRAQSRTALNVAVLHAFA